ncbi:MAG: amidohydrolase [Pseudomonadota bacterium]|uniref:amidohydrolase n=1 Tax=Roseovarius TaxID=74030 RepID=UPI0022A89B84|nr:amidohydrolase [Roseovarius sp. EGI FJ00037]MCZ0812358.1 amidohydrolase [Roseovarius sp. EGI FJ00037]
MDITPVDTIVINGRIATMHAPGEFIEAMAVSRGWIVATGSTADIRALAPHAQVIDCAGRTVLPGFIDSHCHPDMHGARLGRWTDLSQGPDTMSELLELVAQQTRDTPQDAWFVGFGYDDLRLGGYPARDALDAAAGGRPAFLYRRDSHLGFANSGALAKVGFDSDSPDPPFGRIDRHPDNGEPTGLLRETAAHAVVNLCQSEFTTEDFIAGLQRVFADFASYGITSVHNALASTQGIEAYQRMRESGVLKMRVGLLASGREDALIDAIIRSGWRTGFGDEWVRLTGVEWCPDCSTSGRTAAYYDPYVGKKVIGEPEDNRGMLLYEAGDFNQRVLRAHRAGLLVGADGVGDRGIDFVLDAYEHALRHHPVEDHRMRVEHCCNVTPSILKRLQRLKVICSSATGFAYDLGDAYIRNRGADAMRYMWPHRTMIDAGIIAPGHSDSPVCHPNPMRGIHALVNRRTPSGADLCADEAITVFEALQAYTMLGAYAGKEEHIKGLLTVGRLADFTVLEDDIFAMPHELLAETRVAQTYIGGERIFDRANPS